MLNPGSWAFLASKCHFHRNEQPPPPRLNEFGQNSSTSRLWNYLDLVYPCCVALVRHSRELWHWNESFCRGHSKKIVRIKWAGIPEKLFCLLLREQGEDRHGYNRIMTPLALRHLDKPHFQRYYLFIGMSLPPGTKSPAKIKAVCQSSQTGKLAPSLSISRLERSIAILRKTEIIQFALQQQSQNDSTWKGEGEFVCFHFTYSLKTCA